MAAARRFCSILMVRLPDLALMLAGPRGVNARLDEHQ
jgi:hypothetical protein